MLFFWVFVFFLVQIWKLQNLQKEWSLLIPKFWKFDAFSLFFFSYNVERRYIDFFNFSLELKNTWTFHSKLCPVVHRNFVSWLLLIYLYIFINHLPIQKTHFFSVWLCYSALYSTHIFTYSQPFSDTGTCIHTTTQVNIKEISQQSAQY